MQYNIKKPQRRTQMTYFSKGKKMYKHPANSTIARLKKQGYKEIVWENGDFIYL